MDGLAIAASLIELCPVVTDGLIRQIYEPRRGTFVFHLFAGRDVRLLLSPREAAIHLTQLDFPYPQTPSPFVMLLRKHLRGGKIVAVRQPGWERIASLEVERRAADGAQQFAVVVELLRVRGNLILLKDDRVVAAWRADPRAPLGSTYQRLPSQQKLDPTKVSASDLAAVLQEEDAGRAMVRCIDGIGRQTARAILDRAKANLEGAPLEQRVLHALTTVVARVEEPQPEYDAVAKRASFFKLFAPGEPSDSLGAALDREYSARHESAKVDSEQVALRADLSRAIAKRERTISRLREWLAGADFADTLSHHADLVMTYHSELSRGAAEVVLTDPATGKPVKIPLDPRRSPVENAQALYKRAKRLRRGRPIVTRRLVRIERELAVLKEGIAALEEGQALGEEAVCLMPSTASHRVPVSLTASRVFQVDGYTVEVGKDAAQNDALLRKARPDDLWLHAKGIPGSHVIVHRGGRAEIPRVVIEKAARLAAQYSKAKAETRVEVSTALAKHVRKPKGSPPGLVILSQEDTLTVEPQRKGDFP